jgi:WD40 repeat protein
MGSLDLDTFDGLMKGGNHGTVVAPGKSQESRLYLMIAGKATPAMPLSGNRLSAEEIETVRKWIDAGARPPAPGEAVSAQPVIPDIRPRGAVNAEIASLAWRPDGKLLALGTYRQVRLVDPATSKVVAALDGHAEVVRAVAFSPDGKLLAAAGGLPGQRGEVRLWSVETRAEVRSIQGHDDCIYAVAFSRDGKLIATSSYDKLIKLWDAATGKEVRTLKDHIDAVYALQFTPDGRRLVSGAADRAVKIWDVATGERLYTLGESLDGINAVALDPEGKRVAAGGLDKTIRIWSLGEKGGRLLNSLIAHEDAILRVAWSPDGKLLATTAADRTIKVFQAAGLTEIRSFSGQPDWVMALEFAPDGGSFAAGRFDGSLEIVPAAEFQPRGAAQVARR